MEVERRKEKQAIRASFHEEGYPIVTTLVRTPEGYAENLHLLIATMCAVEDEDHTRQQSPSII